MDCGDSSQSYFFSPPNNLTLYPDHAPASSRTASYTSQARARPKPASTYACSRWSRLHKVRRGTPNGRLVRQIVHFVRLRTYWDRRLPMVEDDLTWLPAELADFMGELNYFVWNFNWALDIGWQNFMERADGTLVLSDPVIDYETYQAHVH